MSKMDKKLTWQQHMKRRLKLEEEEANRKIKGEAAKDYICKGCGKSTFTLKAIPGQLIRTCKNCETVKIF